MSLTKKGTDRADLRTRAHMNQARLNLLNRLLAFDDWTREQRNRLAGELLSIENEAQKIEAGINALGDG